MNDVIKDTRPRPLFRVDVHSADRYFPPLVKWDVVDCRGCGGQRKREAHSPDAAFVCDVCDETAEISAPELWDADPSCAHDIEIAMSGVRCTKCPGWYCL